MNIIEQQELSKSQKEVFVKKIAEDPKFSHAVFGRFGFGGGHFVHDPKGLSKSASAALKLERVYAYGFEKETGGLEFQARVFAKHTDQGEAIFVLTFNDRQGDTRPSSHTDYALVIPNYQTDPLVSLIEADPSLLVDVFKKVYPQYDRSKGMLTIDPKHPKIALLNFDPTTQASS